MISVKVLLKPVSLCLSIFAQSLVVSFKDKKLTKLLLTLNVYRLFFTHW